MLCPCLRLCVHTLTQACASVQSRKPCPAHTVPGSRRQAQRITPAKRQAEMISLANSGFAALPGVVSLMNTRSAGEFLSSGAQTQNALNVITPPNSQFLN